MITKRASLVRVILLLIFRSGSFISTFSLYRKTRVSFSDFVQAVTSLKEKGFVTEEENLIKLTKEGYSLVLNKLRAPELKGSIPWREVPERFKRENLFPSEPYIPNVGLLDKKLFNIPRKRYNTVAHRS